MDEWWDDLNECRLMQLTSYQAKVKNIKHIFSNKLVIIFKISIF